MVRHGRRRHVDGDQPDLDLQHGSGCGSRARRCRRHRRLHSDAGRGDGGRDRRHRRHDLHDRRQRLSERDRHRVRDLLRGVVGRLDQGAHPSGAGQPRLERGQPQRLQRLLRCERHRRRRQELLQLRPRQRLACHGARQRVRDGRRRVRRDLAPGRLASRGSCGERVPERDRRVPQAAVQFGRHEPRRDAALLGRLVPVRCRHHPGRPRPRLRALCADGAERDRRPDLRDPAVHRRHRRCRCPELRDHPVDQSGAQPVPDVRRDEAHPARDHLRLALPADRRLDLHGQRDRLGPRRPEWRADVRPEPARTGPTPRARRSTSTPARPIPMATP